MSALGGAMSYIKGVVSPSSVASPASVQSSSPSSETQRPDARTSYFPDDTPSTDSSGRSSLSDDGAEHARPQQPQRSHTGSNPLEAMSRDYAAPTEELDIAKQLALAPRKRSLHDSLKRNATFEPVRKIDDAETKARKLAAAKAELRALAGTL